MGLEGKTGLEGDFKLRAGTINFTGTVTVAGSRVGFSEGVTWNFDETVTPIWDRGTASHWKHGRGFGELTLSQTYVDSGSMIAFLDAGTVGGSSFPRIQAEFISYGTAGAVESVWQFSDIAKKHFEMNEPEGDDMTTWGMSFDLFKKPVLASGTLISG